MQLKYTQRYKRERWCLSVCGIHGNSPHQDDSGGIFCERDSLRSRVTALENGTVNLEYERKALLNRASGLEEQIHKLQNTMIRLGKRLHDYEIASKEGAAQTEKTRSRARERAGERRGQMQSLETQVHEIRNELQQMRQIEAQIANLEENLALLREGAPKNHQQAVENAKLKHVLAHTEAHVKGLQDRLAHLQRRDPAIARKLIPIDDQEA